MTPNERRAELMRRNIRVSAIAKDLGIAVPSVSQVISNKRRTPRIQAAIAVAIGRPVAEVFPENMEQS